MENISEIPGNLDQMEPTFEQLEQTEPSSAELEPLPKGYKKLHIQRLVSDLAVAQRIQHLFMVEEMIPRDIYTHLNGELQLSPVASPSTNIQIIRNAINQLVSKDVRDFIDKRNLSKTYNARSRKKIAEACEAKQREMGMVVFSDEQFQHLVRLRKRKSMQIGSGRCDNKKLAAAMNKKFETDIFTAANCRMCIANHNMNQKKRIERLKELKFIIDEEVVTKTESVDEQIVETNEAQTTDEMRSTEGLKYLALLEDCALGAYIRWVYFETEIQTSGLDARELNTVLARIASPLKYEAWEYVIKIIEKSINAYSASMQQFLQSIAAECHVQLGDATTASKKLEFGVRTGGELSDRLNAKLQELSAQEPAVQGRIAKSKKVMMQTLTWPKK